MANSNVIEINVSCSELVAEITGQFCFMQMMVQSKDNSFIELIGIDLNDIRNNADNYFTQMSDENGIIVCTENEFKNNLSTYLLQWNTITDVAAIRQNVIYKLSKTSINIPEKDEFIKKHFNAFKNKLKDAEILKLQSDLADMKAENQRLKDIVYYTNKSWHCVFSRQTSKMTAREIHDFWMEQLPEFKTKHNLQP